MSVEEHRLFGQDTTIYSARPDSTDPFHPWKTDVFWDGERFRAVVAPGFVNYDAATVGMSEADIASQELPAEGGRVALWDGPQIPLSGYRVVGDEGDGIPAFFRALGAQKSDAGLTVTDAGVKADATIRPPVDAIPPRALWAIDLSLAMARASYSASLEAVDGTGDSGSTINLVTGFNTSTLDERGTLGRVSFVDKFVAVKEPTLADRLAGLYADAGEDRVRLATVYLLAPPGILDGPPDAAWEPYVQYSPYGCQNLVYQARNDPPPQKTARVTVATGLVGGLGDSVSNRFLTFINDQSDVITQAINSTTNKGFFWSI